MKRSYSLLTLLLIVTICGLAVAVFVSNQRFSKIQKQFSELSTQTGIIQIDDDTQVYVRRLHQPAPLVFTYQLVVPAGKRFMLNIGEGFASQNKPLEILNSSEISGPRPGFNHPVQRTISIYLQNTRNGWYAGYENAGGSGRRSFGISADGARNDRLDWIEKIVELNMEFSNPPPGFQHKVQAFDPQKSISLCLISENTQTPNRLTGQPAPKVENPRTFAIWLEPIEDQVPSEIAK